MGHGLIGGTAGKSETITIQVRLLSSDLSRQGVVELVLQQSLQSGQQVRDQPHVHRCFLYPASELLTAGLPVSSQDRLKAASTFRPMQWQCTCLSQW